MNVRLTPEQKIKVLNTEDLAHIMQQVLKRENKIDRNKEHLWVVCLANNNRILLVELVSLGTVNSTLAEPMEIFSFALQKQAVKIILVHNHPSGELTPSLEDRDITDRMAAIGDFVRTPLIDHIIITETSYYSFADSGLLDKLRRDSSFDLTFAKQEELQSQLLDAQKATAREVLKTKLEMVMNSLEEGLSVDLIAKLSGLSREEVEKLKAFEDGEVE